MPFYADQWHEYRRLDGRLACLTARRRKSGGGKFVIPVTWRVNPADGAARWAGLRFPGRTPVYGMHRAARAAGAVSLLISEGEKTADAAHRLAGAAGWAALSAMGGCRASARADWSEVIRLARRRGGGRPQIVFWPDADRREKPSQRLPAAEAADRLLGGLAGQFGSVRQLLDAVDVRVVLPPEDLPHGWSLDDAETEGKSALWTLEKLERAAPWPGPGGGWETAA